MEDLAKYMMLVLLALPFAALASDALGKTESVLGRVVLGVTLSSWVVVFLAGGFQQRTNVANLFMLAFMAWPVVLLVAKGLNPALCWSSVCFSVPVMSWYLVNISMQFYYPTNGGGGGMGGALGLFFGWSYMVIPFALLCGVFFAGRKTLRGFRGA